ncbi:ribonuclease H-like domain-containing protein, partial [Tanacetum coccineum]
FLTRSSPGLFLSQSTYAQEILERAHMQNYNLCRTHVDTESNLGADVQQVCLYMHDPLEPHLAALKRILRYVRGTIDHGLQLYASSTSQLTAYTNAGWAAEYRGVANVIAETAWVRNLLRELHAPLFSTTLVYCDNVSAVYLSTNPVQHQRTKNIKNDIHFVRDLVAFGQVRVLHVPSRFQYVDIFTKGLLSALFLKFCSNLKVQRPPALTAGGDSMIMNEAWGLSKLIGIADTNPEKAFLKTVIPQLQTILGMSLIEILSMHYDEVFLGERDTPVWTRDNEALVAFENFGENLREIEKKIEQMNLDERLRNRTRHAKMPYTLFYLSSDIGLMGRGILFLRTDQAWGQYHGQQFWQNNGPSSTQFGNAKAFAGRYEVDGYVYNSTEEPKILMTGKWNQSM